MLGVPRRGLEVDHPKPAVVEANDRVELPPNEAARGLTLNGQRPRFDPVLTVFKDTTRQARNDLIRSIDGLDYYFIFDHWHWTVPQALNQGLDGSLYLATNTGPGWLRNPLLAYALQGIKFVDPLIIHDEKEIGDDGMFPDPSGKAVPNQVVVRNEDIGRARGSVPLRLTPEVPFCDHAIAENVFLNGRWRHLLCYWVCDLRETNGEGAPPTPQTGLYLAELEYGSVTHVPFRFEGDPEC